MSSESSDVACVDSAASSIADQARHKPSAEEIALRPLARMPAGCSISLRRIIATLPQPAKLTERELAAAVGCESISELQTIIDRATSAGWLRVVWRSIKAAGEFHDHRPCRSEAGAMISGTQNHLTFKRLARILGIPTYRVVGLLESLWMICVDCCDEGNIGKSSDAEIAEEIGWDGSQSPAELMSLLADVGWLDRSDQFRYVIHAWQDHAPTFIKDRLRKRRSREVKAAKRDDNSREIKTYGQSNSDKVGQPRTSPELSATVQECHSLPITYSNQASS